MKRSLLRFSSIPKPSDPLHGIATVDNHCCRYIDNKLVVQGLAHNPTQEVFLV